MNTNEITESTEVTESTVKYKLDALHIASIITKIVNSKTILGRIKTEPAFLVEAVQSELSEMFPSTGKVGRKALPENTLAKEEFDKVIEFLAGTGIATPSGEVKTLTEQNSFNRLQFESVIEKVLPDKNPANCWKSLGGHILTFTVEDDENGAPVAKPSIPLDQAWLKPSKKSNMILLAPGAGKAPTNYQLI